MIDRLPAAANAMLADLFAILQIPGGSVAGLAAQAILDSVLRKRLEAARTILIAEVRRGDRHLPDSEIEETVSILYRYLRAAHEGTARLNLRLLARIIGGQAQLGTLVADEFLRYADTLATLKREEIMLLGTVCRHMTAPGVTEEDRKHGKVFVSAGELIPKVFPTSEDFNAAAAALTRTGYIVPRPAAGGSINYGLTSALERLNRLARLDTMTVDDCYQ